MSNISYKVFDSFHDLLVSLEELIDYKDYVLSELELANSNLDTDEEAVKRVNYYSNELKKVNDKLNEVFNGINSIRGNVDLFKSQRADIIDESVNTVKSRVYRISYK